MRDALFFLPLPADMGLPMIVFAIPAMLILLIPIIVVEGLVCKKMLGLTTWQAMKSNAFSNLASTLIGIPIAWLVMLTREFGFVGVMAKNESFQNSDSPLAKVIMVLFGSAWVGPPEGGDVWFLPAVTLVLLIPFFFASYWVEYRVIKRMVGKPEGGLPILAYPRVRIAVRNANLITYGAMFVATSVWLVILLPRH